MELKDQVVSLELAEKLKKLGVMQESLFYWFYTDAPLKDGSRWELRYIKNLGDSHFELGDDWCSAFTVAELGEILPDWVGTIRTTKNEKHKYWICSDEMGDSCQRWPEGPCPEAETEADARAKMLIYLLENKLINL